MTVFTNFTRLRPDSDVTLMCNVASNNTHPMSFNYTWIHVDTSTPLTSENSPTLSLSSFSEDDVGTYRCEVRSEAGLGMGNITIELGGESYIHYIWCILKLNHSFLSCSCGDCQSEPPRSCNRGVHSNLSV